MILFKNKTFLRWFLIGVSFVIISLILWNTYVFFQSFKKEERSKMQTWAKAQKEVSTKDDISDLDFYILTETEYASPMLVLDSNGEVNTFENIDESLLQEEEQVKQLVNQFKKENTPIDIKYSENKTLTIYYGNSPTLNKLKYYPLALILIIVLFVGVVYFFYKSNKNAEQNKLWTGMAKETAHQIGTPLSSLVGWTEILKAEAVNPEYIEEIEKDINRLKTITERFSKIGSIPKLEKADIVILTKNTINYLKSRTSKLIEFDILIPNQEIYTLVNAQLYSWTIENLVKNAIDAMKGKGLLTIQLESVEKQILLSVSDTGKGIPKSNFNKIFQPGFTTKKRGWGLGLSLAKRIVEDYHKGKIRVLKSEISKGTTIQVLLNKML